MAKSGWVWDGTQFVALTAPVGAFPNAVGNYSATAPTNPKTGQIWLNTNDKIIYVYNGSSWISTNSVVEYSPTAPSTPATGEVWYDTTNSVLKVYSGSVWVTVTSSVNLSAYAGHISPSVTNTYDLGSTSYRWRNIYTQDLHLSNGIGDYTVVEGEEDLFLVNNKTGKSFKFALIEVESSEIPPQSEQ